MTNSDSDREEDANKADEKLPTTVPPAPEAPAASASAPPAHSSDGPPATPAQPSAVPSPAKRGRFEDDNLPKVIPFSKKKHPVAQKQPRSLEGEGFAGCPEAASRPKQGEEQRLRKIQVKFVKQFKINFLEEVRCFERYSFEVFKQFVIVVGFLKISITESD